jgi:hypothetical protein
MAPRTIHEQKVLELINYLRRIDNLHTHVKSRSSNNYYALSEKYSIFLNLCLTPLYTKLISNFYKQ